MSIYTNYPEVAKIAEEQGWNDESMLIHALAFIHEAHGLDAVFLSYLKEVQDEENHACPTS